MTLPTTVLWWQVAYLPVLPLPLGDGRVSNLPPHQFRSVSVTSRLRIRMLVLITCLLGCGFSVVEAVDPPKTPAEPPQPSSRTVRELEGWTLRVDDRLLGEMPDAALGTRALKFLEAKLVEIKAVVPAERLKDLQSVTIVMDLNCGKLGSMQYHPSAGWLKANGYPTDLAKCVHLPRAADLPTRRNINEQPWVILHELAHAFHDQKLDFEEPRIKAAYDRFKESGHGNAALLYNGKRVKHYGLTDQKEFFAEMTEAFFGVNDFYPFNRAELQDSEPDLFKLLTEIWIESPKPSP